MRRERAVADGQLLQADAGGERVEQADAAAQQVRRDVDQDLVAQASGQRELAGGGAAQLDVLAVGDGARLADGAGDAIGDERQVRRAVRVVGGRAVGQLTSTTVWRSESP